jgi:hypothetical protein
MLPNIFQEYKSGRFRSGISPMLGRSSASGLPPGVGMSTVLNAHRGNIQDQEPIRRRATARQWQVARLCWSHWASALRGCHAERSEASSEIPSAAPAPPHWILHFVQDDNHERRRFCPATARRERRRRPAVRVARLSRAVLTPVMGQETHATRGPVPAVAEAMARQASTGSTRMSF